MSIPRNWHRNRQKSCTAFYLSSQKETTNDSFIIIMFTIIPSTSSRLLLLTRLLHLVLAYYQTSQLVVRKLNTRLLHLQLLLLRPLPCRILSQLTLQQLPGSGQLPQIFLYLLFLTISQSRLVPPTIHLLTLMLNSSKMVIDRFRHILLIYLILNIETITMSCMILGYQTQIDNRQKSVFFCLVQFVTILCVSSFCVNWTLR